MKLTAFLEGAAIGALTMFMADPEEGRRRRALVRDQVNHQANKKRETFNVMVRDFTNRAHGIQAKVQGRLEDAMEGNFEQTRNQPRRPRPTGRWTPGTGLLMSGTGLFLALYGLGRRGFGGTLFQVAGIGMIAKAFYDTEHRYDPIDQRALPEGTPSQEPQAQEEPKAEFEEEKPAAKMM